MTLLSRIEKDYIASYKAKKELRVAVLRMLKAAVKNRQVELMRPLEDDEVLEVVVRQGKQRNDSIEQFRAANRDDLAEKEAAELEILQEFMPTALSPEELEKVVDQAVASLGASSMKDMGKVMNTVMGEYKGRVDGKALSALVRSRLSS